MSVDFFPGNVTASAKCGKVSLTCWANSYVSAVAEDECRHAFTEVEVTAETDGLDPLAFVMPLEFWADGGTRYFDTMEVTRVLNVRTEEDATAEEVKALEKAAGGLSSVLWGAVDFVARRVAIQLMAPAFEALAAAIEEEQAA